MRRRKRVSRALVVDHGFSPARKRYFLTYEDAHRYAMRKISNAITNGEQVTDRIYLWYQGESYSYDRPWSPNQE